MSYRKSHVKTKIQKIRPKKSILKKAWFWFFIIIVIIILTGSYFILFYSGFQLKNVNVSGNSKVTTQDVKNIVAERSQILMLDFLKTKVSTKSIFLIDSQKIKEDILVKFPEIENVSVSKKYPQTFLIVITERKPIGVYCEKLGKYYSIDINGIVFDQISKPAADTVIVRQTNENMQIAPGKQAVDASTMQAIFQIQKDLKDNFDIGAKEAIIISALRMNIITSENWKIFVGLQGEPSIALQLQKMILLLNGGMSADENKSLKYIDLRPKDRAIVCANNTCGE